MNEMRKLMESVAPLFEDRDRVEMDTDRYYADQERAEQQAQEDLPYEIESIEHYIRTNPDGKKEYKEYFMDNAVENPQEYDIDLLAGIIQAYFDKIVGDGELPVEFLDSESMDQLIAKHLQDRGYSIDPSEIERRRT